jgi:type III secretory pathway lipoprotein EscJ
MKKTLLQIFEENNLLDSPETENLINKINELIKQDVNTTTKKEN